MFQTFDTIVYESTFLSKEDALLSRVLIVHLQARYRKMLFWSQSDE